MTVPPTVDSSYPTRVSDEPQTVPRRGPVVHGTADDGPLDAEQLEAYQQRGFCQFDQLVSPADVLELDTAVGELVDDRRLDRDERVVTEAASAEVRSIFEVHRLHDRFAALAVDPRLVEPARQILGSEVYLHQSRVNLKPGFRGRDFFWHSDFETWHAEDGMAQMRALSVSISLTPNDVCNGSLMVIPGSHHRFVGCRGRTPVEHYRQSLRAQEYGVPSDDDLTRLVAEGGIHVITGGAGSAVMFDCNLMHGSSGNITPFARRNLFLVFNSVQNRLGAPFAAEEPRPGFIAARR